MMYESAPHTDSRTPVTVSVEDLQDQVNYLVEGLDPTEATFALNAGLLTPELITQPLRITSITKRDEALQLTSVEAPLRRFVVEQQLGRQVVRMVLENGQTVTVSQIIELSCDVPKETPTYTEFLQHLGKSVDEVVSRPSFDQREAGEQQLIVQKLLDDLTVEMDDYVNNAPDVLEIQTTTDEIIHAQNVQPFLPGFMGYEDSSLPRCLHLEVISDDGVGYISYGDIDSIKVTEAKRLSDASLDYMDAFLHDEHRAGCVRAAEYLLNSAHHDLLWSLSADEAHQHMAKTAAEVYHQFISDTDALSPDLYEDGVFEVEGTVFKASGEESAPDVLTDMASGSYRLQAQPNIVMRYAAGVWRVGVELMPLDPQEPTIFVVPQADLVSSFRRTPLHKHSTDGDDGSTESLRNTTE